MTTKITDVLIWSRSKFVHVHCKVLRRWLQRWPAWHQKLPPGIRLGNLAKSWPGVSTRLSIGWTGHMESTIGIEADCGHNGNLDMKKVLRDDVGQIRSNDDQSTKWYRFPSGYYLGGVTSKSSDWSENQMVSILVSKGYVTDNQGRENAEHIILPPVEGFARQGIQRKFSELLCWTNIFACIGKQALLPLLCIFPPQVKEDIALLLKNKFLRRLRSQLSFVGITSLPEKWIKSNFCEERDKTGAEEKQISCCSVAETQLIRLSALVQGSNGCKTQTETGALTNSCQDQPASKVLSTGLPTRRFLRSRSNKWKQDPRIDFVSCGRYRVVEAEQHGRPLHTAAASRGNWVWQAAASYSSSSSSSYSYSYSSSSSSYTAVSAT